MGDTLIINSFPRGFCASSAPANDCREALALMMMTVLMRDCRASFGTVAARPFLLAAAAHYRPLLIQLFRADPQLFHRRPSSRASFVRPNVQIFKISRLTRPRGSTHALLRIGPLKINRRIFLAVRKYFDSIVHPLAIRGPTRVVRAVFSVLVAAFCALRGRKVRLRGLSGH